ncbi:hypothetical protein [Arthrobacter sp. E3]|uniref:hypothetical protein n=1 Tax=Arthrobacter sp. E3 TaxID=517402 RepID=UPI001A94D03D|nr:hypothetical protein [Arthrobacter sp. E3]
MDAPLKSRLPCTPFTLREAEALGLSPDLLRSQNFEGVSHGLYRPASWDFELRDAARALCAATPGAWISHTTAARLHGLILPPWLLESNELHLSKPRKLVGVRRKGVIGHTVLARPGEVETDWDLRISTRARTWLDLARTLPLPELTCIGDQLIRMPRAVFEGRDTPYATIASLRTMLGGHRNLQGIVRAREALSLLRVGADSGPETLLRLAMLDAGLPEPDLQLTLWESPGGPSADLGYRRRKIAIQYDGSGHLDELQVLSDQRRDSAFRNAGWTVLIFGREDLADGFTGAVRLVKKMLRGAWMDPAVTAGFCS